MKKKQRMKRSKNTCRSTLEYVYNEYTLTSERTSEQRMQRRMNRKQLCALCSLCNFLFFYVHRTFRTRPFFIVALLLQYSKQSTDAMLNNLITMMSSLTGFLALSLWLGRFFTKNKQRWVLSDFFVCFTIKFQFFSWWSPFQYSKRTFSLWEHPENYKSKYDLHFMLEKVFICIYLCWTHRKSDMISIRVFEISFFLIVHSLIAWTDAWCCILQVACFSPLLIPIRRRAFPLTSMGINSPIFISLFICRIP